MYRLFLSILLCCATISGIVSSVSAEQMLLFPGQNLKKLILIATDPEQGSFTFLDKYGEEQYGIIGDLIGTEEVEVVKLDNITVTVKFDEEYETRSQDGSSLIRTRTVLQRILMRIALEGGIQVQ